MMPRTIDVREEMLPMRMPAGINRVHVLIAAGLLLATLLVYLPVFSAGYIWDDTDHVHRTAALMDMEGLSGLANIWTHYGATPQYYPLVHTTFWFELQAWGLNPAGFHVVNVLLHATNVILLFFLLRRLKLGLEVSALAAALFALHPVMVESVAWISERKNVLSLALYLGALHAYFSFRPIEDRDDRPLRDTLGFYGLALILFAGALLSKTVTATWPAAVLVLIWWKRGRLTWRDALPLLPFFILGLGMGLFTAYMETYLVGARGGDWALSPLQRLLLATRVPWFYAGKLLWPRPLMFFYERWHLDTKALWQYAFPVATVGLLAVLWMTRRRLGRGALAAILLFGGTLFPALGLFNVYPFRFSFVADHFQYHAAIGLLVLLAAGLVWAMRRSRLPRGLSLAAVGILLALLGYQTWTYAHTFRDEETVYLDTITKNPRAWAAYYNLGNLRLNQGRLDEAIDLNLRCLAIRPEHALAAGNLAAAYAAKGDFPQAMRLFDRALELDPNLASTYVNRGVAYAQQGDLPHALADLDRAIELRPDLAIAYQTRAMIHLMAGQREAARADVDRLIELGGQPRPDLLEALQTPPASTR
jgi:tetratricopeptide (TPR) repeat protein